MGLMSRYVKLEEKRKRLSLTTGKRYSSKYDKRSDINKHTALLNRAKQKGDRVKEYYHQSLLNDINRNNHRPSSETRKASWEEAQEWVAITHDIKNRHQMGQKHFITFD